MMGRQAGDQSQLFYLLRWSAACFGCGPAAGNCRIVPVDPTKPLLPNPNSASSEIGFCGNLSHRERPGHSPLGAIYGIKSDTLALSTDRIFVT